MEDATARWISSELEPEAGKILSGVEWRIGDLYDATLGLTANHTIWLDATAAGHGWFIDPTPQGNAEYHFVRGLGEWITDAHSSAAGRMDLMTTVMHELGHVLGLGDQQVGRHSATLMTETLPTGVRRSLLTDLQAACRVSLHRRACPCRTSSIGRSSPLPDPGGTTAMGEEF